MAQKHLFLLNRIRSISSHSLSAMVLASPSSTYTPIRTSFCSSTQHRPNHLRFRKPSSLSFRVVSSQSIDDDGSADQFLQNNSIADFMRFKKGDVNGSGELQTAVVSYRKKFPWSLLWPFLQVSALIRDQFLFLDKVCLISMVVFLIELQVDLVSTIHIADKEYVLS